LSVGKKVRAMWEALHGRAAAYRPALACTTSPRMMRDALARNVWRGAPAADASVDRLVRLAFAQAAHLALQPLAAFQAGLADFLPAREACR
jgi:cytochrome b pre-mRNA-processing protein 3